MVITQLIKILEQYLSEDYIIYIDTGKGLNPVPLDQVVLDYTNSEEGILVLKNTNN